MDIRGVPSLLKLPRRAALREWSATWKASEVQIHFWLRRQESASRADRRLHQPARCRGDVWARPGVAGSEPPKSEHSFEILNPSPPKITTEAYHRALNIKPKVMVPLSLRPCPSR